MTDHKVWVLSCPEPGCAWNDTVPRQAQRHHRNRVTALHLAAAHRILPMRLSAAVATPRVMTAALWDDPRIARLEMREDVDLLLAAYGEGQFTVRSSVMEIRLPNGSRVMHLSGSVHHVEQRLRGTRLAHIDDFLGVDRRLLEHITASATMVSDS